MTEGPIQPVQPPPLPREELFEGLLASATDFAIFTLGPQGAATSWNLGAERLFGFSAAEMLGQSADLLFTEQDQIGGVPATERETARAEGLAAGERWYRRKDGALFWASASLTPLRGRSGASQQGFVKIVRDRTEQHRAEQALRRNEERFRVLATSIPQLVFRTRPDGQRSWASPQWLAFTGLSLRQSQGFGWLQAIHPEDREATRAAWDRAGKRGEYYMEHRVWSAEAGQYRWHQTRARPVEVKHAEARHAEARGADGGDRGDWVGTMTDIEDLRSLQGRQQVLLAELQHRTRNLLAVVQSIAIQTIQNASSLDIFTAEFKGRLSALGRVQSLLAESDAQDIDLHALLMAELTAHGSGALGNGRISIEGPAVALPAPAAQAVGLALHELATNAVKYGALTQPEARLSVVWTVESIGNQQMVRLEWRERDVVMPPDDGTRRRGYGTELIERALPYQLKAQTSLEFFPDGVRCMIGVPLLPKPPPE
ncbi:PAS domain S-box protein [Roseomonas sp. 18066]|uniref:PAS domain S-box protein n=1 Tax=Roseomonas sp. 18066 TaxID=2681412 RepID=UPI00135A9391|nr:PAS domain S-box protein [Roseomonas sp. 18066]